MYPQYNCLMLTKKKINVTHNVNSPKKKDIKGHFQWIQKNNLIRPNIHHSLKNTTFNKQGTQEKFFKLTMAIYEKMYRDTQHFPKVRKMANISAFIISFQHRSNTKK
jgi:hypothetical protein